MSETTPLVSIIMAVKDTAPYLPACLDSIIAQSYAHWELIAINDHSSDATPQILEHYANQDSRIKICHSDRPKLIPTLKYGYQFVQGELINRMDSDDQMPVDKIETLVRVWQQHGKGHVIAGGTQHFVDSGKVGGGFLRYEQWLNKVARENRHIEEIYKECVIPSHSWLMHKEDLDMISAFEPEIYPEDYDLCFRIYQAGLKIIGIDKVLHFWRDRGDRISRTWEEYEDNRYFEMKLKYFLQIDRDPKRPLVLWGAGKNGKDMAKLLQSHDQAFHWVCQSPNKIGHKIYNVVLQGIESTWKRDQPQLMIVVASPNGKREIRAILNAQKKEPIADYWFFL